MTDKTVIFVCTGNTCRSPMAEMLLKNALAAKGLSLTVRSAGLHVADDATAMHPNARTALKKLGVKLTRFAPKVLTKTMATKAFAIIAMSIAHKNVIVTSPLADEKLIAKTYALDEIAHCGDIPDPYGDDQTAYDHTAATLSRAIPAVINFLMRN